MWRSKSCNATALGNLSIPATKTGQYCTEKGIHIRFSSRDDSAENGVAEHANETQWNTAQAIRIHTGLPEQFWNYAEKLASVVSLKRRWRDFLPSRSCMVINPILSWSALLVAMLLCTYSLKEQNQTWCLKQALWSILAPQKKLMVIFCMTL